MAFHTYSKAVETMRQNDEMDNADYHELQAVNITGMEVQKLSVIDIKRPTTFYGNRSVR